MRRIPRCGHSMWDSAPDTCSPPSIFRSTSHRRLRRAHVRSAPSRSTTPPRSPRAPSSLPHGSSGEAPLPLLSRTSGGKAPIRTAAHLRPVRCPPQKDAQHAIAQLCRKPSPLHPEESDEQHPESSRVSGLVPFLRERVPAPNPQKSDRSSLHQDCASDR